MLVRRKRFPFEEGGERGAGGECSEEKSRRAIVGVGEKEG